MNAHLQFVSIKSANLFDVAMNIPFQKMRQLALSTALASFYLQSSARAPGVARCRQTPHAGEDEATHNERMDTAIEK